MLYLCFSFLSNVVGGISFDRHQSSPVGTQGPCAIYDVRPKRILNSNLVKSRLPTTYFAAARSFWNFAPSTPEILSCSVQNLKTIGSLRNKLWANHISRDLGLRCGSGVYPKFHRAPAVLMSVCLSRVNPILIRKDDSKNWVALDGVSEFPMSMSA